MKYLLWLCVVLLVVWVWKNRSQRSANSTRAEVREERMYRCAHCGVYFPAPESVDRDGLHYCSAAHRDAAS